MKPSAVTLCFCVATLIACLSCGSEDNPSSTSSTSFVQDFDALWGNFDRTYSYFAYKKIDWDSARVLYRPLAESATNNNQLISVFQSMLAPLRDIHVWLKKPDNTTIPTFTSSAEANYDFNVLTQYFARYSGHAMSSNWGGYAIIDSIPYIALATWVNGQTNVSDFDQALEQFKTAPGMIIDVRMNGGGNDLLAYQVAGRFTSLSRISEFYQTRNGPRHTDLTPLVTRTVNPRGSWQYGGRVALLIGRKCYSSNESFVAAMKVIPTVTLIGDTTGGGSGNPAVYSLSSGWQYSVSTWIAYTADTSVIEWKGIPPAIRVKTMPSDFAAGTDPVIEFAKAWVKDPGVRVGSGKNPLANALH